jgi:hypothetical protein
MMSVNKIKDISYRGVDIGKVLAIPLYGKMVSNVFKAIFHCNRFDSAKADSDIVVIYTHCRSGRTDYFQITTNLIKYISELSPALFLVKPSLSIVDKVRLVKHLILSLCFFSKLNSSTLERLYLILLIARVKVNVDYVLKFLESCTDTKVLVTFCDAHDFDNIITQCANVLKIKTVTLQHGQYCIDEKDTPENMALTNLCSNYLCAWGQATCDEFEKVNNSKTKLVSLGSLRSETSHKVRYTAENLALSEYKKTICVMLNADNCIGSNIEMLKNDRANYNKFCVNPLFVDYESVGSSDIAFSIIFTSGVMIELLSKGQVFFLYQNLTTPKLFRQSLLSFSSSTALKLVVDKLYESHKKSADDLNSLKEYFINTHDVPQNYLTFFKKLLQNKLI